VLHDAPRHVRSAAWYAVGHLLPVILATAFLPPFASPQGLAQSHTQQRLCLGALAVTTSSCFEDWSGWWHGHHTLSSVSPQGAMWGVLGGTYLAFSVLLFAWVACRIKERSVAKSGRGRACLWRRAPPPGPVGGPSSQPAVGPSPRGSASRHASAMSAPPLTHPESITDAVGVSAPYRRSQRPAYIAPVAVLCHPNYIVCTWLDQSRVWVFGRVESVEADSMAVVAWYRWLHEVATWPCALQSMRGMGSMPGRKRGFPAYPRSHGVMSVESSPLTGVLCSGACHGVEFGSSE